MGDAIILVYCWAHVRRKFWDACPPKSRKDLSVPAAQGLKYCDDLFAANWKIDQKFKQTLDYEWRKEKRLKKMKPIVDDFFVWVDKQVPKKGSLFHKAINYAKEHKEGLYRFLEDGRCSLSNNLSEQEMKAFVVGRKNWLFCDSYKGAEALATWYTVIRTAHFNLDNVYYYLVYLLKQRPSELMTDEEMMALMPWQDHVIEEVKAMRKSDIASRAIGALGYEEKKEA